MKILSLHIEEFAGLRDRRMEFGTGLNIIEGDNESGKSTVWLFIKFMLYGMPRRGSEERARSVSRVGHVARGSMTVLFQEEEYRIVRSFTDGERTGREQCAVYRVEGGSEVFAGRQPGEVFLGVPREVFDSSCGVGQMQCHHMGDKKGLDAIRNLLSSADESVDVTKVLQRLDKIRVHYRHKTGKGGKLFELNEQIVSERAKQERAELNHRRKQALEERLCRTQEQWTRNEADAERIRTRLIHVNRLATLRRFDKLRENEELYENLQTQRRDLRKEYMKTDVTPTQMDVARLRVEAERLTKAEERLSRAEEARARVLDEISVDEAAAAVGERVEAAGGALLLTERVESLQKRRARGIVASAAGAVAALACVIIGFLTVAGVAFAAVLPLIVAALGAVGVARSAKELRSLSEEYGKEPRLLGAYLTECADAWRRKREYMDRILRADGERDAAEEELRICRQTLTETMARTLPSEQIPTAELAMTEAARLERFLALWADTERQSNALALRLNEEREVLADYDEDDLRASIPEELLASDDGDLRRLEREQGFCAERRRALEATRDQIRIELANLNAESASPMEISDRVASLTREYQRAERYYDALVKAMEALEAASETMSGTVTPRLGRDASAMMSYISDGAYTGIRTGNELSPSLWKETGSPVPPELMSGGTRDAAYLSLRIALMMQIFERELPPLMLDESLCSLDDRRMERMLAFLGKLSETRLQCLLFTCHKREAAACEAGNIPFCRIELR